MNCRSVRPTAIYISFIVLISHPLKGTSLPGRVSSDSHLLGHVLPEDKNMLSLLPEVLHLHTGHSFIEVNFRR